LLVRKKEEPTYEESKAVVFIEKDYYYVKSRLEPIDKNSSTRVWALNEIEPLQFVKTIESPQLLQNAWPLWVANHQSYRFE